MEIHNRGKFHEYSFCGCQVKNVQMFSDQQKVPFLGSFGRFLGHNSRRSGQILSKLKTVTETILLHNIYYGFLNSIENSEKINPKPISLGLFRFLGHALPHPKDSRQIFYKMKDLMEIHSHAKFHLYSICGCQIIFSKFLGPAKRGILGCFWVVFHKLQPPMKLDLHQIFTSDALQSQVSYMLRFLM